MRSLLKPYIGPEALNYLGVIATELLGVDSLVPVIGLLSGFRSMTDVAPESVERAIRRLRMAHFRVSTDRDVSVMIAAYEALHRRAERQRRRGDAESPDLSGRPRRFAFGNHYSVRRLWGDSPPQDIVDAIADLTQDAPFRPESKPFASASVGAGIDGKRASWSVSPLMFDPVAVPAHDVSRVCQPPAPVRWVDLVARARAFDELDRHSGRQAKGGSAWFGRLHEADGSPRAVLQRVTSAGLSAAEALELEGIRHLIGLPGAGKTTLLYLLAAELAARGHKVCFLFPSIRVSITFLEVLALYDVECALLSGQSEGTRAGHLTNYAAAMKGRQSHVGDVPPGARNFATVCTLSAFCNSTDEPFPHSKPPCLSLLQVKDDGGRSHKPSDHRCALAGCCGRQYSERALTGARIWAGHVMSLDRGVNRLYSEDRLHHFELLARTFDLVVVDECDGAQAALDAHGAPAVSLFGDDTSLSAQGGRSLARVAYEDNARFHGEETQALLEKQVALSVAGKRMANHIASMENTGLRKRYADQLITTVSLIADLFEGHVAPEAHRKHFEWVWDWATKSVAFNDQLLSAAQPVAPSPDDDHDDGDQYRVSLEALSRRLAEDLQLSEPAVADHVRGLQLSLIDWERTGQAPAMAALVEAVRKLPWSPPDLDGDAAALIELLVVTTMVVLKHLAIAPYLRILESLELLEDDYVSGGVSAEMRGFLPESLVGRLNGVRYQHDEGSGVRVTHVAFSGTPRLLFERLHRPEGDQRQGPSVLLTSATSFLEASPSYHVDIGPDYLLSRPNAGQGWQRSVYRCLPLAHPHRAGEFLRFSGVAIREREFVLEQMVDALLDADHSPVEAALRGNDVEAGVHRRAAFIVNSYAQSRTVYEAVLARHPAWARRTRFVIGGDGGARPRNAVLASEVEDLGSDTEWDLLIFPMAAIGRGVNIVFQFGDRRDQAMLGSLFFLTRPHPRADGLELIQGMVGRAGGRFERARFDDLVSAEASRLAERLELQRKVRALLRTTQIGRRLSAPIYREFVADQMCQILQTLGRGMRGDRPAFAYFVDLAWAPQSALGKTDTARSSMLVAMRELLDEMLASPHDGRRGCYESLYRPFQYPLSQVLGLNS